MSTQTKKIALEKEKVSKIFWKYAIPSLIGILAQNTAGLIDSIFIGRFIGADGLSAITLISPFIMLYGGIGTMLAIGGSTMAGIFKGKGDIQKSNNYFVVTISLLCFVAVIGTIVFFYLGGIFSYLLKVTGPVANYISNYTRVLSLFILPFLVSFAFLFFLKLDGNPTIAVATSISGTVINIFLNYLFIVILKWKMTGAAFATGLSQFIPFLIFVYLIACKSSWKFCRPKFFKKDILKMVFNGSSEFLTMASTSIAGFIYNALIIKHVGLHGVAANTIAMQVASIAVSIFYGFAESVQPSISVNMGAKKLNRVKKLRSYAVNANLIAGLLLCVSSLMFSKYIVGVFVKDQAITMLATSILSFYAVSFVLMGFNVTLATYYTSVNSPLISCIIALSRSLVAFIIGLYLLPLVFKQDGIWMAVIFAELITIIIGYIYLKKHPYGFIKSIAPKQVA